MSTRQEGRRGETRPNWTRIPRPLSVLPSLAPSFSFLTCLLSPFLDHSLPPVLVFVQNTLLPSFYLTCGGIKIVPFALWFDCFVCLTFGAGNDDLGPRPWKELIVLTLGEDQRLKPGLNPPGLAVMPGRRGQALAPGLCPPHLSQGRLYSGVPGSPSRATQGCQWHLPSCHQIARALRGCGGPRGAGEGSHS